MCQSICVQNTSVCQSAGGGIKSHLVTALVFSVFKRFVLQICENKGLFGKELIKIKMLELSKLKEKIWNDVKLLVAEVILTANNCRNLVGKVGNDGYQNFLLFSQGFQKAFFFQWH